MSRDWKPGDVAMVTTRYPKSSPRVMVRRETAWATEFGQALDADVIEARPLVVIDPDDPDQVARLSQAWDAAEHSGPLPERRMTLRQLRLRAALRSMIEPPAPPKPDEPTGLGAVVEDSAGNQWIRCGNGPAAWMLAGASPSNRDTCAYDGIGTVRVLSEGVPS